MANQERPKRQDVKNFIYNEQGNVVGASFRQYERGERTQRSATTQQTGEQQPGQHQRETGSQQLFSQELTGAQAQALLGGVAIEGNVRITKVHAEKIAKQAKGEKVPRTETFNKASSNERDETWNGENSPYKHLSYEEQLVVWEKGINRDLFNKDKLTTDEQQYLQKLGIDVTKENPAEQFYKRYAQEQEEDVGSFARTIAHNTTAEELVQHRSLIRRVGEIYGNNSAEVIMLLVDGLKNAESNPEAFNQQAVAALRKREQMPGYDVLTSVQTASKQWEKKQAQHRQEEKKQHQEEQTIYERRKAQTAASGEQVPHEMPPGLQEGPIDNVSLGEFLEREAHKYFASLEERERTERMKQVVGYVATKLKERGDDDELYYSQQAEVSTKHGKR